MKSQLEPEDIQMIEEKVLDLLKPYLLANTKKDQDDTIFDVAGLCEYLKVSPHWVHERTHLNEVPFRKLSNKQLRFRKRDIDKWLDSLRTPAFNLPSSKVLPLK